MLRDLLRVGDGGAESLLGACPGRAGAVEVVAVDADKSVEVGPPDVERRELFVNDGVATSLAHLEMSSLPPREVTALGPSATGDRRVVESTTIVESGRASVVLRESDGEALDDRLFDVERLVRGSTERDGERETPGADDASREREGGCRLA